MKIACETLINSQTGLPLEVESDLTQKDVDEIGWKTWRSGARIRAGLFDLESVSANSNGVPVWSAKISPDEWV